MASKLAEKFQQPDQTVEYHFMIQVADLKEADLGFETGEFDIKPPALTIVKLWEFIEKVLWF